MTDLAGLWTDLARGGALGLAVAAPIGPISLLCIQRTLAGGFGTGLATGCGVATTHAGYAFVAAAGLAVVADTVANWSASLQVCCAVFLIHTAVRTARRVPVPPGGVEPRVQPRQAYLTGLAWSLINPTTLLGYFALAPVILGQDARPWRDLPVLAGGVLLGSAAWWAALTLAVACAGRRLDARGLRLVNLTTATGLAVFALVVLTGAAGSRPGGSPSTVIPFTAASR